MAAAKRTAGHQRIVHAIIDRQIEEKDLGAKVLEQTTPIAERLKAAARGLVLKGAQGVVPKELARQAFARLYQASILLELARSSGAILELVDRRLEEELAAINALGEPLSNLAFIASDEVRARELEKAGLTPAPPPAA